MRAAIPARAPGPAPGSHTLVETSFSDLDGFADDDHDAAYRVWRDTARHLASGAPVLRPARDPGVSLLDLCRSAVRTPPVESPEAARRFFTDHFVPWRIAPDPEAAAPPGPWDRRGTGFLTGYYEPVVEGSLTRRPGFDAPVLARPPGLGRLGPGEAAEPFLARDAIEAGALEGRFEPLVWLRDWVEVFLVQVQGSARVGCADGPGLRLVYDGRNGHPYTSIGRHLVETGRIAPEAMSLERLESWLREAGQEPGQAGRDVMWRNRSYVFFRAEPAGTPGPIGGAGLPLAPLRSIAVDRAIWPYGLPVWVEAALPWEGARLTPFRRLMVAQDTGSAIVGPARADLFFGTGPEAGRRAGGIRHPGTLTVLLPREPRGTPGETAR